MTGFLPVTIDLIKFCGILTAKMNTLLPLLDISITNYAKTAVGGTSSIFVW